MKIRTIYILRRNFCYDSSVSNVFIHTYVYIIYISTKTQGISE